MAQKLNTTPVAVVTYKPGTGKVRHATHITIKVAGVVVATATKGGRYSQDAALAEFIRLPGSFKREPGWALYEAAQKLAA